MATASLLASARAMCVGEGLAGIDAQIRSAQQRGEHEPVGCALVFHRVPGVKQDSQGCTGSFRSGLQQCADVVGEHRTRCGHRVDVI
ncbi:hypothetical protein GCM10009691_21350 [Brevibacterium picturae]|uniref:Uncharacterized protein n=1 Tax=Brevibacterium picturae TaxID=260553 RepID=A0ABP4MLF1_9MICO